MLLAAVWGRRVFNADYTRQKHTNSINPPRRPQSALLVCQRRTHTRTHRGKNALCALENFICGRPTSTAARAHTTFPPIVLRPSCGHRIANGPHNHHNNAGLKRIMDYYSTYNNVCMPHGICACLIYLCVRKRRLRRRRRSVERPIDRMNKHYNAYVGLSRRRYRANTTSHYSCYIAQASVQTNTPHAYTTPSQRKKHARPTNSAPTLLN